MKRLGILGGMGPESTAVYYLDVVRLYRRLFHTRNAPLISIDSLDVVEVLSLIEAGEREPVAQILRDGVQRLHAAGASLVIIASNTPHIFFEQVAESSPVAMLSIVDATCDEAQRRGHTRLGVLGTTPTIRSGIYQAGLQRRGIECCELSPLQQEHLHRIYVQELLFGQVIPKSVEDLYEMTLSIAKTHELDAVVLAGTELSLAFPDPGKLALPLLVSGSIHVESALRHLFDLGHE